MKYEESKQLGEEQFRRLTGVKPGTYEKMVEILKKADEKKKRHTIKSQVVVEKKTRRIIYTSSCNGKCHDFRLFKESKTHIHPEIKMITDTGYLGIQKIHQRSELPKKRSKKCPLAKNDKKRNRELSSQCVLNENVIGIWDGCVFIAKVGILSFLKGL